MRTRELQSRARRGAKALDKKLPNWFRQNKISITTLDLQEPHHCVVGQLRLEIPRGAHDLGGVTMYDADMGFAAYEPGDYPRLTAIWVEEIRARRRTVTS